MKRCVEVFRENFLALSSEIVHLHFESLLTTLFRWRVKKWDYHSWTATRLPQKKKEGKIHHFPKQAIPSRLTVSAQVAIHLQDLAIEDSTTTSEPATTAVATTEATTSSQEEDATNCVRCLPFSCFCRGLPIWLTSGLEFKDIPLIRPPPQPVMAKSLAHAAPLSSTRFQEDDRAAADTDSGESEDMDIRPALMNSSSWEEDLD